MEWSIINQNRSLALNAVLSSTDGGRCSVEGVKWIWASRCRCGLQRNTAEKRRGQAWEFVPRFPFFLCRQTHNMAD